MSDSPAKSPAASTGRAIPRPLVLALCLFATWFIAAYLYKAGHATLFFDSAWHGAVAKNLALGPGYASSYDGYVFFDPDVTTGPAPIALMAAAVGLFGNAYSLPLYVASALHLCLFIAVTMGFARTAGWRSAVVFSLSFALLQTYFEPRWWQVFTGDMSALLWGVLGLQQLVVGSQQERRACLFLAGLFLGLALLSKSVGIMFLAAACVYVAYSGWRTPLTVIRTLLPLLIGVLVCMAPWQLYKGSVEAPRAIDRPVAPSALSRKVVGVVQLVEAPDKLAHVKKSLNISNSLLQQKLDRYGLPWPGHLILILASLGLLAYAALDSRGQRNHLLLALSLVAAAYWLWYMVLCVSLEQKYTLYPLLMAMVLVLYWLSRTRLYWLAPALVLCWIAFGSAAARQDTMRFYSFGWEDDTYRTSLHDAALKVQQLYSDDDTQPLAACGWLTMPWPLEYVLPGSRYFENCYRVIAGAMEQVPGTDTYRWREDVDLGFVLVVDELLWAFDRLNTDKNAVMLELCGENPLYRNEFFRILQCRDEQLRAGIVPGPDSPFLHLRRPGE